jgi:hypothetical protein
VQRSLFSLRREGGGTWGGEWRRGHNDSRRTTLNTTARSGLCGCRQIGHNTEGDKASIVTWGRFCSSGSSGRGSAMWGCTSGKIGIEPRNCRDNRKSLYQGKCDPVDHFQRVGMRIGHPATHLNLHCISVIAQSVRSFPRLRATASALISSSHQSTLGDARHIFGGEGEAACLRRQRLWPTASCLRCEDAASPSLARAPLFSAL